MAMMERRRDEERKLIPLGRKQPHSCNVLQGIAVGGAYFDHLLGERECMGYIGYWVAAIHWF